MTTLLKQVRQVPSGIILPLDEVRHRVVIDAIDKCGGNYLLAAKMLGIGKTTIYRWSVSTPTSLPRIRQQHYRPLHRAEMGMGERPRRVTYCNQRTRAFHPPRPVGGGAHEQW